MVPSDTKLSAEAVLVISPHAGRSRKLAHVRREIGELRIRVAEELAIEHLDRLPECSVRRTGSHGW